MNELPKFSVSRTDRLRDVGASIVSAALNGHAMPATGDAKPAPKKSQEMLDRLKLQYAMLATTGDALSGVLQSLTGETLETRPDEHAVEQYDRFFPALERLLGDFEIELKRIGIIAESLNNLL